MSEAIDILVNASNYSSNFSRSNHTICLPCDYITGVFHTIFINVAILGNGLIAITSLHSQHSGNSSIRSHLLNMCLVNFIAISYWPLSIDWSFSHQWRTGELTCMLNFQIKQACVYISFFHATAISFCLYLTIVFNSQVTGKAWFVILKTAVPWVVVVASLYQNFQNGSRAIRYDEETRSCSMSEAKFLRMEGINRNGVMLPLVLYFYLHILFTVKRSTERFNKQEDGKVVQLAKMFAFGYGILVVGNLPSSILVLLDDQSPYLNTLNNISNDLPFCLNPLAYILLNSSIKKQALRLLWPILCCLLPPKYLSKTSLSMGATRMTTITQ
ncbi:C-X-C chemokine receptor type 3-like [Amia ocellicauda]|uniref:C-X-C chemokine receptor type 3-like n=1 Tax=Amia ocellicauda TaxID=2972642 RepID=UPI0034645D33